MMAMGGIGNCRIFKSCPMPSADAQNHRTRSSSNPSQKNIKNIKSIVYHNLSHYDNLRCHPPMLKITGYDSRPIHKSTVSFHMHLLKKIPTYLFATEDVQLSWALNTTRHKFPQRIMLIVNHDGLSFSSVSAICTYYTQTDTCLVLLQIETWHSQTVSSLLLLKKCLIQFFSQNFV